MKKIFGGLVMASLLAGAASAQAPKQEKKAELVEKTGVVQVQKADTAKKEKYDTVLLVVGADSIKLLPGKDKKSFKTLEGMAGKTITVLGEFLPARPPKYPLAALKVESFSEAKPAAPAKP
ncbi:MAG: hypothetical protein HY952_07340 [Elusimicrobia bacterium]|nr:hypothetical protein [Elusimicrobiota bacterium]